MIAAPPAALLAAGLFTKDHYERNTALLAAEAFADVEILDLGLKYSTRRLRPNGFHPTRTILTAGGKAAAMASLRVTPSRLSRSPLSSHGVIPISAGYLTSPMDWQPQSDSLA
jgi:hypothetical protein